MTTMTLEQKADACKMLYRGLGFARMGSVPAAPVADAMQGLAQKLHAAGVLATDACNTVALVISQLGGGRMADEATCKQAMEQVNQVRLPLLRECREAALSEAAGEQEPQRPRERG